MPLHFNMLLTDAGIQPGDVRLLRHQDRRTGGLSPFVLWRDDRPEFERYQSAQRATQRAEFRARYWASFVVPPDGSTLFAGLYEMGGHHPVAPDWVDPLLRATPAQIGVEVYIYEFRRVPEFDRYNGRLRIDWGPGFRAWVQRADSDRGPKQIIELSQAFREPEFPGYTAFVSTLAGLTSLPVTWGAALSAAKGVYLLTCPRTKEQYVGAAYGSDGFWGRWQSYAASGHGGNVGLKSRDPADYQISILEVAGSAATVVDLLAMEALWKAKLQSREMGLNRN